MARLIERHKKPDWQRVDEGKDREGGGIFRVRPSVWGCGQGGDLQKRLEVGYLTYFLRCRSI